MVKEKLVNLHTPTLHNIRDIEKSAIHSVIRVLPNFFLKTKI